MAAVHPLAAPRPGTRQQKPRPLAASAHAPPPSLLVDARQRGRVHSQSQERGRRGRLGGARRPWRPKTHVPLARVRNFRVREGFTSGRETYLLHQRLLTRETKSVIFLLPSARGARGCETCGLTKLLLRLGFIGSCLRAAPLARHCSTGRRHGKRGVAGAIRTDGGKHDCCLHTGGSLRKSSPGEADGKGAGGMWVE